MNVLARLDRAGYMPFHDWLATARRVQTSSVVSRPLPVADGLPPNGALLQPMLCGEQRGKVKWRTVKRSADNHNTMDSSQKAPER